MQCFAMGELRFLLDQICFVILAEKTYISANSNSITRKTVQGYAKLDDTDQALIAELRRDGRASLSDLAARLGVARATVRARMERLQASGEIAGFSVLTRGDVTASPVRALMMIGIEGRGAERIMARITGLPEVLAVHSTNGRWDLIAEIGARTLEDFDAVLFRIRGFDGVSSSETSLMLTTRRAGRR
jgi:DNA-binding Lrp family transcriptional regulator